MPRTPEQREQNRIQKAKYNAENREKVRALQNAWYAAKKDSIRARRNAAYTADPTKAKAYNRTSYLRHRAKRLAERKVYVAENREAVAAGMHANYMANREERCAYAKAWKAAHPTYNRDLLRADPERGREYVKTRRARKLNAPISDLTPAQWQMIQAAQQHRCAYCGKRCKGRLTQAISLLSVKVARIH